MNSSQVKLKLDYCSHEAAKFACEHWHYSKKIPVGKLVKIGIWEDDKFIGCVLFSRGANNHIGCPYKLDQTEICELTRIALKNHKTNVSKIISIAIRLLVQNSNGVKLIISYADINQDHLGIIYQASNFIYTGLMNDDVQQIINGRAFHRRSVFSKYGTNSIDWIKENIDQCACWKKTKGKHKYLYPLTDDMKIFCEKLRKPYPKRIADDSNLDQQGVAV